MQIAIFNYFDSQITIFNLSKEIEQEILDEDNDFDLDNYVRSLPGYYEDCCFWLSGENNRDISVRIGNQEDFPEFNLTKTDE